jgi:hypothetical protein
MDPDEAQPDQQRAGLASHSLAVDQPQSGARLFSHEEILGNG